MVLEHRQVVDPVGGHPDQVPHRQGGVPSGVRRRGHRDVGIVHGMGGLVEFGQCGAGDDRDGMAAMGTHLAGGDAQLQSDSVVRAMTVTAWPRWEPISPEAMPSFSPSLMPS